ncbi:MAG: GPP34 family phosphoprotein [Cyclobacteriaceae bacterium]
MRLSLAEGLYLIALDDEEGRLLASAERTIDHGLVAAALLELVVTGRLALEGTLVVVKNTSGTGNKVLDSVLSLVGEGGDIIDVVKRIVDELDEIQNDVTQLLVTRGIIRKEATKLLWIPVSERMGNANYAFEQEIRDSLYKIVMKNAKPTPAWVVLMTMIHYNNLLGEVFKKKDDEIDAVKVAKDKARNAVDANLAATFTKLSTHFSSL